MPIEAHGCVVRGGCISHCVALSRCACSEEEAAESSSLHALAAAALTLSRGAGTKKAKAAAYIAAKRAVGHAKGKVVPLIKKKPKKKTATTAAAKRPKSKKKAAKVAPKAVQPDLVAAPEVPLEEEEVPKQEPLVDVTPAIEALTMLTSLPPPPVAPHQQPQEDEPLPALAAAISTSLPPPPLPIEDPALPPAPPAKKNAKQRRPAKKNAKQRRAKQPLPLPSKVAVTDSPQPVAPLSQAVPVGPESTVIEAETPSVPLRPGQVIYVVRGATPASGTDTSLKFAMCTCEVWRRWISFLQVQSENQMRTCVCCLCRVARQLWQRRCTLCLP